MTTQTTPSQRPSQGLTTDRYREALLAEGLISVADVTSGILAEKFDSGSIPEIEFLLLQSDKISEQRLRNLKAALLGLPPVPLDARPLAVIPKEVAASTGSIALSGSRPMVAFINPTTQARQRVAAALGGADYEVYTTTVTNWRTLYDVCYANAVPDYPALETLEEVMAEAVRRGASDFHIVTGEPPSLRIDGDLHRMENAPLDAETVTAWLSGLAGEKRWKAFLENFDADQAISYDKYRIRLNYGRDRHGPKLAGRLIPKSIPTPEQLNLPPQIIKLSGLERGLVLVTGPTGSGKSTTLAALLNYMAMSKPLHIITLEDPIEYFLTPQRAVVSQREKGEDFHDFAPALRQALRQDPDVILVGELRDRATMEAALVAAETGHLVFGTLHTYDAVATVNRYVNAFPADEQDQIRNQLAYLLEAVISQTLVPRREGGRVAAMEILLKSPATSQNMRKVDGLNQLRSTLETHTRHGMQTMEVALARLVKSGQISREMALYKARRRDDLENQLGS